MRRVPLFFVILFALSCLLVLPAVAQEMKLHIAHWNVPNDPNTKVLETIAKDIEEASGGKIKSEISWQALGRPGDYYDALANNLCDIALFGPTYSPGRFPISEMMTLPIRYTDNRTVVMAYYKLWKKGRLDQEFRRFRTIAVGNNATFHVMWRRDRVDQLPAFRGMKISAPYHMHTQIVENIGATPVAMPVSEVYSALDTGVIDATFQIYVAMPLFKLHEVVKFVNETSMSCGPYLIAVNNDVWKKLPEPVKKVLDEKSEYYSMMMADGFQALNDVGKKLFLDAGGQVIELSADDNRQIDEACRPIFDKWINEAKRRKLPAEELLDDLYNILVDLGVEKPFAR